MRLKTGREGEESRSTVKKPRRWNWKDVPGEAKCFASDGSTSALSSTRSDLSLIKSSHSPVLVLSRQMRERT